MDATTGTVIMILCYVFGTGLMIAEAFMPGFGVAGISGIILEIIAIVLTGTRYGLLWGLIGTFGVLLFAGIAVFSPAGFIEIDGTRLNASTSGEFLEKGAAVRVSGAEGDHLVVRKL